MESNINKSSENSCTQSSDVKPNWHRPTLTTIDIKRTMKAAGSVSDGSTSQLA